MRSRLDVIKRILNEMGVYEYKIAIDIDNGKVGFVTALGGMKVSYERLRTAADKIMATSKGL